MLDGELRVHEGAIQSVDPSTITAGARRESDRFFAPTTQGTVLGGASAPGASL
ncbi:MAG: hypothetical protein ABEI27_09875 [Halobellus sp.]|uniref:hypothetical protein n=1 Tax=Halobellus sp. TaxID=1979212 RepID=UPI0035D444B1